MTIDDTIMIRGKEFKISQSPSGAGRIFVLKKMNGEGFCNSPYNIFQVYGENGSYDIMAFNEGSDKLLPYFKRYLDKNKTF